MVGEVMTSSLVMDTVGQHFRPGLSTVLMIVVFHPWKLVRRWLVSAAIQLDPVAPALTGT
jgi:hypothetical protein